MKLEQMPNAFDDCRTVVCCEDYWTDYSASQLMSMFYECVSIYKWLSFAMDIEAREFLYLPGPPAVESTTRVCARFSKLLHVCSSAICTHF